ncbi:MAG: 2-C-methyl-D-erythritol 4-phosphate cytidylyltransferase, partial [Firmicutes bacterium]|nr:2-C-methyl-D-erythritol 4-phosphate cytidylyltransferase [Bacillota bacterium]
MVKAVALVPAAGAGRRMGSETRKQYLMLGGRPLIVHCLQVFQEHPLVTSVVLVVAPGEEDRTRGLVTEWQLTKIDAIVPGGGERQESVRLGLKALPPDADFVLIHDAARPFIDGEMITASLAAALRSGAAVVAVPVKDTIKLVRQGCQVETTLDRNTLWAAQTPQAFACDLIRKAHQQAVTDGFMGTDDASLVERLGYP